MSEAALMPSLADATSWVGADLAGLDRAGVGQVAGLYVDSASRDPAWLIARLGRRRTRTVAVPLRGCAGAPFGVWASYEAEAIRGAPVVDPSRPLRREHELTICAHFGIGETVGRAAEVVGRPADAVTATPPGD